MEFLPEWLLWGFGSLGTAVLVFLLGRMSAPGRLKSRQAREELDRRKKNEDQAAFIKRRHEAQLVDLALIRRAILEELKQTPGKMIEFGHGGTHLPSDQIGSLDLPSLYLRRYWLSGNQLMMGLREGMGAQQWVWPEGMAPNQQLIYAEKQTADPDHVNSVYERLGFERLLVAKFFPKERFRWKVEELRQPDHI